MTSFLFAISSRNGVRRAFLCFSDIVGKTIRLDKVVKISGRFGDSDALIILLIGFGDGRIGAWAWGVTNI